jgi:hypothetical protein
MKTLAILALAFAACGGGDNNQKQNNGDVPFTGTLNEGAISGTISFQPYLMTGEMIAIVDATLPGGVTLFQTMLSTNTALAAKTYQTDDFDLATIEVIDGNTTYFSQMPGAGSGSPDVGSITLDLTSASTGDIHGTLDSNLINTDGSGTTNTLHVSF